MSPYTLDAYMLVKNAIENNEPYEVIIARLKRFTRLFDSEQGDTTTGEGEVKRKAEVCRGAGVCNDCGLIK